MTIENLVAHSVPLYGKHLIEASAGTGKTFNITRLYVRLLLERELTVQEILVMTFTKAATEEIKGRIDNFLRDVISFWDQWIVNDEFFTHLAKKVEKERATLLLRQALLFLDEASIFTIHGFCQRVLSQHAFVTGLSFNATLDTDGREIELLACRDWYRKLALENETDFLSLVELCATPESFYQQFVKAIQYNDSLSCRAEEDLLLEVQILAGQALNQLLVNQQLLSDCLIDVKKGDAKELRLIEWRKLIDWLKKANDDSSTLFTPFPDAFIDGKRFSRHKQKLEITAAFALTKDLKTSLKHLTASIKRAKAMRIVKNGITALKQLISDRKQLENTLTFDDLISTLAHSLIDGSSDKTELGSKSSISNMQRDNHHSINTLATRLFEQYPAALVDEFQDTDPKQYAILQSIYGNQEQACLFMIGDPKQAIYGFRGGDVFAYLSARNDCDYQWVMDTNWRSSKEMITGYNRLFYGNDLNAEAKAVFGYGIPYIPVKASPNASGKVADDNGYRALQFIHFPNEIGKTVKQSFRAAMANWCAQETQRLLATESIQAQHIALLVRDGTEGEIIKQALAEYGLASVYLSNRANLFKSEQAKQLITILHAILYVENEQKFTAACATTLLDISPSTLVQLQQDELAWQNLKFKFIALRDMWRTKSFITMALKLMYDHIKVNVSQADRALTNVLHLFEMLQSASQRHHQPAELLHWFEQECAIETPNTEAELRLESEDNLIRIVTQHGSKGLEYPYVFVPFCTRHKHPLKFGNRNVSVIEYHEDEQLIMSLDGNAQQKSMMADEQYAETIRLLYVAITRAEQRVYLLTTAFEHYSLSPLGKTLRWQKEENIEISLKALASEMPEAIGYEAVHDTDTLLPLKNNDAPDNTHSQCSDQDKNKVAEFTGLIERDWWLSSFTALNRNLRHIGISAPDRDQDNGLNTPIMQGEELTSQAIQFSLSRGAQIGNFLHDILEHIEFSTPDWQSAMHWPLKKYTTLINQTDIELITAWLSNVLLTPLNNIPLKKNEQSAFSLASLANNRVLKEMEFYFPVKSAKSSALTKILSQHRDSGRQRDLGNATHVSLPALKQLKGMMHGFIDLIFEHEGRFYVCDYKSNYLGDNVQDYQTNELRKNIESHNYDLQYLIYSVALHRYLRLTIQNYSIERHFGGVYYLYLRGMGHRQAPNGTGVYFREIHEYTLNALDQIFDGETLNEVVKDKL